MTQTTWIVRSEKDAQMLGLIPSFIHEDDPRPAKEQFDERYRHGGGWTPFKSKMKFIFSEEGLFRLVYPASDDGPEETYHVVGITHLRDEVIAVFEHAWVVILQKDKTWELARMD